MKTKLSFFVYVIAALMLCSTVLSQNKPAIPELPQGKVQQTISRTTFVDPSQLDKDTLIKAKVSDNLTLLCHLYGSAPQGGPAHHGPGLCALPAGKTLDTTERQKEVNHCHGGGANTPLRASDIPPGMHIECQGDYFWAVIPPVGLVRQGPARVLSIRDLYCGPAAPPGGGCNVIVDVYAKFK